MNLFVYNGVPSTQFEAFISGSGVFRSPEPDFQTIEIPGRNGDLVYSNRRMRNVEIEYSAFITHDFTRNFGALRAWLLSDHGYHRLEDTYHPEEYRVAMFTQALEPDMLDRLNAGKFTITFSCKPQRFLKAGENPTTFTGEAPIYNLTQFPARPLLRCYGAGTFSIGAETVTIEKHNLPYIDIDCDIMDCFCGAANANRYVTMTGFPELPAGATGVSPGGLSKIIITPRWWTV